MKWKVVLSSPFWVHSLIITACAYVIWDGAEKLFRYKLFPYVVVGIIVIFSIAEVTRKAVARMRDRKAHAADPAADGSPDLAFSEYDRRAMRLIAWLTLLIALFYVLGPTLAVAAFMVTYLSVETKIKWINRILIVAAMTLTTQYLFIWALDLTVPQGLISRWMG